MLLASTLRTSDLLRTLNKMLNADHKIRAFERRFPFKEPETLLKAWRLTARAFYTARLEETRWAPETRQLYEALADFQGCCEQREDAREILRCAQLDVLNAILRGDSLRSVCKDISSLGQINLRKHSPKRWRRDTDLDALRALQGRAKELLASLVPPEPNSMVEQESAQRACALMQLYRRARDAWENALEGLDALDFDRLITGAHTLLRGNEQVRERVAKDIDHLLIDEFQDTDSIQLDIANLLAAHPEGPSLFIVGDPKQSIYYFRGAEVEVFEQARQQAGEHVVSLADNFRTVPPVLEFVNQFFRKSGLLRAVEPEFTEMLARREDRNETCVEFLLPQPPEGAKWNADEQRRNEAELIARRMRRMVEGEEPVEVFDKGLGKFRRADYSDMAMLFRSTSDIGTYEEALRRAGIDYVLAAGQGFYKRQEITDVLNLLKLVVDPWNEAALLAFLRSPLACLSDETLLLLSRDGGLAQAFMADDAPTGCEQVEELVRARALVHKLRREQHRPVHAFLRRLLEETGYEAVLLSQYLGLQKASNLRKLVAQAHAFARRRPPSLRAFIQYLDEVRGEAVREGEATLQPQETGAVNMLTVHKSKGLEFPIVFVPNLGRHRNPPRDGGVRLHKRYGLSVNVIDPDGETQHPVIGEIIKTAVNDEEEAEEARLLYVAMTRARDRLVLAGAAAQAGAGFAKHSWADALDSVWGVAVRKHDATLEGEGWQAVVCREADAPEEGQRAGKPEVDASLEALRRRAAPLVLAPPARPVISVSALLHAMGQHEDHQEAPTGDEPALELWRPERQRAMLRGTLVHRMFEHWDFTADTLPPIPALVADAGLGPELGETLAADLAHLAELFRASPLAQRFAAGPVRREHPFLLRLDEVLVAGTIDAILSDGAIVDFKTGRYAETRHRDYEWQLLLYAAAAEQLTGQAPPGGVLYYADEGAARAVVFEDARIAQAMERARRVAADVCLASV